MSEKVLSRPRKLNVFSMLKGVFGAIIISVVGILLFAVVLKFADVSEMVIKIVNQVIKILSVFFGVKICLKNNKEKALIKGFCLGGLYTVLSYLIFSLLSSSFSFGLSFVFDLLFAGVFGVIFGVLFANNKR